MTGTMVSFLGGTVLAGGAVPVAVSNANPLPVTLSGGLTGLAVSGVQPAGALATENPVLVSGIDNSGIIRDLRTDATGALVVAGGGGGNVQGVNAANVVATPFPVIVGGQDPTGTLRYLQTDASGSLIVSGGGGGGGTVIQGAPNAGAAASWFVQNPTAGLFQATSTQGPGNTANPWTVGGPVASGVTTSGNPVKQGGVFNTTPPTVTTGQAVEAQFSNRGVPLVNIVGGTPGSAVNVLSVFVDGGGLPNGVLASADYNIIYNGSGWDRLSKPRASFKLPSSAATNNAANIKSTAGTIYGITGMNNATLGGPTEWLKFFDTTGVPNPAALAQFMLFPLMDGGTFSFMFPTGIYFPTGIGVAIVAGAADLNNTAIGAGDILGLQVLFS